MRDIAVFAIVFGLLPFILKRPVIGVLTFTWLSLMNPHRLAYGMAHDFPFAATVAGFTFIGLYLTRQPKRLPLTPVTVLLIVFMLWMTLTTVFALEQDRAWNEWNRVIKIQIMVLVAIAAIRSEKDIKLFAWVIGLSLAFYGVKGGVFTLLHGGAYRVFGPSGTYIEDNNDLALALIISTPIVWYLFAQAKNRWVKRGLLGVLIFTIAAVLGSYSRGALLGGAAALALLWVKSERKLLTGGLLVALIPLLLIFMPQEWTDRMSGIQSYKEDASAQGRINAWGFAFNVASERVLGGGYKLSTPKNFYLYAPEPNNIHEPHSIYFQVMGEHGFIGLGLFLLVYFMAWRTAARIRKRCADEEALRWAHQLASATQVSLFGYAVGGAFLTLAYFDLPYDIVALLVVLDRYVAYTLRNKPSADPVRRVG